MFYLLYFLTLHHYFKKRKKTRKKKRTPHLPPQFCIIEVHLLYTTITTTIFSCFRQMKKKIKKKTLIYITLVKVFFWQFCLSSRLLNRVWKAWPLWTRNQQEKNEKKSRCFSFRGQKLKNSIFFCCFQFNF